MRREKLEEYKAEFSNPYQAAKRGFVDDVIEPALTRSRVASALAMLAAKQEAAAEKAREFPGLRRCRFHGCQIPRSY